MRFQIQTELEMSSELADLDLGLDLELSDLDLELSDIDLGNLESSAKNSGEHQSFAEKEKLKTKNSDDILLNISSEPTFIWNGLIDMPKCAWAQVTSNQIFGWTEKLSNFLSEKISIVDTIPNKTMYNELEQVKKSTKISLMSLVYTSKSELYSYMSIYN